MTQCSENIQAELYLSFAGIFYRPNLNISNNLEELLELWEEEIPSINSELTVLTRFCHENKQGEERLNALWEHYIPLFETGKVEAPPYASVYLNEGQVLGKETAEVDKCYRQAGYKLGQSADQLPDHLAVELEFMALLARDGKKEHLDEFRQSHLLPFLTKLLPLIENTQRPVYFPTASILRKWQLSL